MEESNNLWIGKKSRIPLIPNYIIALGLCATPFILIYLERAIFDLISVSVWNGIGSFIIMITEASIKSTTYLVTRQNVIQEIKMFIKLNKTANYGNISSVKEKQSLLGRILGYGDIFISTDENNFIILEGIRRPTQIHNLIQKYGRGN
jgi:uncharacterized membrane protein YdbT with pleckstrin-like domain|tara:strand:- start:448 stop:891 length:444 start_codon:yes stop_codon:yes gene_type:complete